MTQLSHTSKLRKTLPWMLGASLALTLAACGDDDDDSSPATDPTPSATPDPTANPSPDPTGSPAARELALSLTGLEDLTEGAYEGWFIVGDQKISTGTFTTGAGGTFDVDAELDLATVEMFVLTIEPVPDMDPEPSGVIVLSGAMSDDGTFEDLTFGADFADASGGFILRTPTDDATHVQYTITIGQTGLEDLTEGTYEGWLIIGEEKVSTGIYTAGSGGTFTTDRNPADADQFVITIEPTDDTDPEPSGIVVLAGDINTEGETTLAFPADLSTAEGGFILRAPTDDATNETPNDEAGVWFIEPAEGGMMAGLTLPALPDGWVYEGWGVTQSTPLTTGRFTDPAAADMASPFSDGGPPFPGEDFLTDLPDGITPPVDLADGSSMIVLSVEPDMEGADPTGAGPFAIKPLALMIPEDAATATFHMLGEGPVVTVSGTMSFEVAPIDNDEAGVWFLEPGESGMSAGLNLPALPSGWVYEGWGVTQDTPLTTGRFVDVAAADLASPYSDGGPPFPGEDFLMDLPDGVTPPVNLADGSSLVVISVEPDIDGADPTGAGPFALKPLALEVPEDAATATFHSLGAGPVTTLGGTAVISDAE